jgi:hypothetical protein
LSEVRRNVRSVKPKQRADAEFYATLMGCVFVDGAPDPESPLGRLIEIQKTRRPTETDWLDLIGPEGRGGLDRLPEGYVPPESRPS